MTTKTTRSVVDGIYTVREVGGNCDGDTLVRAESPEEAASKYAASVNRKLSSVAPYSDAKDTEAVLCCGFETPADTNDLFGSEPAVTLYVFRVLAL